MNINSKSSFLLPSEYKETSINGTRQLLSTSLISHKSYMTNVSDNYSLYHRRIDTTIERVADWLLNQSPMTNKKLQKLCYYVYCWYIVFNNDIEAILSNNEHKIKVLFSEPFQAWIHGPVSPQLYRKYKDFGCNEIPRVISKPLVEEELESLFQQVWDVYGSLNANELEMLSHSETPWKKARKGICDGEPSSNTISDLDILIYYSNL